MATQVETLLPGNPLAKAEEHGKVIRGGEPEEEEGGDDGAKRQTGVAAAEQGSSGGSSPGQGGTPGTEEATEDSKGGCDSEDKQDGVKSRKEFTEAPPPKVNPWTRKMNAVTVVSVNGQAHHGLYPSSNTCCFLLAVSVCRWSVSATSRCGRTAAVTGVGWGGQVIETIRECINKLWSPSCCSLQAGYIWSESPPPSP